MSDNAVNDLVGKFNKTYGKQTVVTGDAVAGVERLPTGIFTLDLALGGGIPRRRMTEIWGQEASNKTNVSILTMRIHMLLYPHLRCVFVDLEHTFDTSWAAGLGLDVANVIIIQPDYAEQAVDMVQTLVEAQDIGLIVIDSLAAMISEKDYDNSSETQRVGGSSLLAGIFVKKLVVALSKASKAGNWPTVICINQMRVKIGTMYGSPDGRPGGKALDHAMSLIIKLYAKPGEKDPKSSADIPVTRITNFTLVKTKMSVTATSGQFDLVVHPFKGLRRGDCDDWNTISNYLKDYGHLVKGPKDKGWVMLGEPFNTLVECEARLIADPKYGLEVRQAIIDRLCKDNGIG